MEVILKEDVAKLGSRGDVVKVAEGYGRNFLLPRKLAIEANEGNKAVIVQMKAASVRRSAMGKQVAAHFAAWIAATRRIKVPRALRGSGWAGPVAELP